MALNESIGAFVAKANEVAQAAAKKAKDVTGIAKAKVAILTEEDKIKKAQIELGKLYYRDFSEGTTPDAQEYLPWCEKITASKSEIEALKAKIEELRASGCTEADDEDAADDSDYADVDLHVEVVPDSTESEPKEPEAAEEPVAQEEPASPAEPETPAEEQ